MQFPARTARLLAHGILISPECPFCRLISAQLHGGLALQHEGLEFRV